ncbi:hypothetical protein N431DRAFT_474668 [Stipitochalara longipes BDJ]|nr:hypothetical protein N431DRAFT_474668 [Stipitochalara longipes BDJ]
MQHVAAPPTNHRLPEPTKRASQIGQGNPPFEDPVIKHQSGGNSARHESSPSTALGKAAWDRCAGLAIKRGAPHASSSRSLDFITFVVPNLPFPVVYCGCRLRETLPNGQPTRFAAFMRGVTNFVTGQQNEDDGANGEIHGEGGPEHHQITEKNILQCENAVKDPRQKDKPEDERVCPNPKYLRGEAAREQIESIQYTRQAGTCPVCVAVEKAIREKTNQTVIRKFERGHKAANGQNTHGTLYAKGSGTTRKKPIVHGPAVVRTPIKHKKKKQDDACRLM